MKKVIFAVVALFAVTFSYAQDDKAKAAELKTQIGAKNDSIAALTAPIQGRADALQAELDALPGWTIKGFGTIGANFSGASNFFNQALPNNNSGNIQVAINAYANLDREKFFWRNSGNVNLQWVKVDDEDNPNPDADGFNGTTDIFNISSLYGYKLSKKWAVSAFAEYRTSFINNFNDPGYLDLGVGATWTPIQDLVVVIHPLNYNFVFSSGDTVFESSLGAKIVADYTKQLGPVNFKTNFTTFQSYDTSDLSNWTWINSFGYTFWKGIGVGFEFGLRGNDQETLNNALSVVPAATPTPTFDNISNVTQTYWLLGLSYSL